MALKRMIFKLAVAVLVVLTTSPSAWAQAPAKLPDDKSTWLPWAIAAGLAVVICLAGFLNAKRSHLT